MFYFDKQLGTLMMQATAQQFLQDFYSHAIALRQRGCEKLVEFIRQVDVQDTKPVSL